MVFKIIELFHPFYHPQLVSTQLLLAQHWGGFQKALIEHRCDVHSLHTSVSSPCWMWLRVVCLGRFVVCDPPDDSRLVHWGLGFAGGVWLHRFWCFGRSLFLGLDGFLFRLFWWFDSWGFLAGWFYDLLGFFTLCALESYSFKVQDWFCAFVCAIVLEKVCFTCALLSEAASFCNSCSPRLEISFLMLTIMSE